MKGALMGGLVAGEAGAIIGSRKYVQIKNFRHNNRRVQLSYFDEDENRHKLIFNDADYYTISSVIPEKDFNVVQAAKIASMNKSRVVAGDLEQLEDVEGQSV